ncbi:MAG: DUF6531 domain-containing protein, partial [Nakamurella sp.]
MTSFAVSAGDFVNGRLGRRGRVVGGGRWRRGAVAAGSALALLVGVVQPAAAAPGVAAASAAVPAPGVTAAPPAVAAGDVAVDGWGDGAGYHVQVSAGAGGGWRQLAVLRPAGMDADSWLGYQCLSGDGKYVAVAVLPESAVNTDVARFHGAYAYSVDVGSGTVHPIASGVGLKYYSPGCGAADDAVFTTSPGSDEASTVLSTVNLASGSVRSSVTAKGQVSSAVPTASGVVGVAGSALVSVGSAGKLSVLAKLSGDGYDVRASADGGVDFLTALPSSATATVHHERKGVVTDLGSGPRTRLQLFGGRAGRGVLTGATTTNAAALQSVGVKAVSDSGLSLGATSASLDGSVLIGESAGGSVATGSNLATMVSPATGAVATVPRQPAASASGAPTAAVTKKTAAYVPPGVATQPASAVPAGSATAGLRPAGDAKGSSAPTAAPNGKTSTNTTAAGTANTTTPTCAVAPGDVAKQVMQPAPSQVDWAAQMAERGLLVGAAYSRPDNWQGLGFPAYAANTDFPLIPLEHPSGTTTTTVPRSVYEAIMAQESNFNQASWHAPAGNAGDPLIADYYGAKGDIKSIDYTKSDCGYGIGQVTDGMHVGDTSLSARGQVKVAVDYRDNIAAGLQILEGKWNQLYSAGIIANNGDPKYLENWYLAAWAYNAGVQPGGKYNTTGCTPGPTCVGDDGTWGMGWSNNPDNTDFKPSRGEFLSESYADAAHPSDWPYQERVMGWMGTPIVKYSAKAYAKPTYQAGNTWLQIPAFATFCTLADNKCDPDHLNTSNPGASHCMLDDFECWWHKPVTWISSCATTCATSSYAYTTGSTEPVFANQNPPTCTVDHSKVAANAIIVDDEASPPANLQGCDAPNWSQGGTFAITPGTNAGGDPVGKIDVHQLGVGLGGHVWFSHTEDGSDPSLINTGTWTPTLPSLQYYTIKIHLPSIGATATDVVYTIDPGGGAAPWKIRVNQAFGSEQWATIGTFAMQNGGTVSLSNQSSAVEQAGQHAYNFDVAWDAVAFIPEGGTPGTPIGGSPTVKDEPHGSNPAWLQCGCAQRTAGDPVDTSTGYFNESFTDLSTPGRGMPLQLTRSYSTSIADPSGPNAALAVDGPFGRGWSFNYDMTAATDGSGNVTITQEDRSQVTFTLAAGVYTPNAPRFDATLSKSGATYTFVRRGQDIFTFDSATGHLTTETARAGDKATPAYRTTLAYNTSGQLSTITDPAGRKYTLAWTGSHITGLADTAGRQVSYAYSAAGDLTDVYGVASVRTPTLQSNDRTTYTYLTGKHLLASMRTPKNYTATGGPGAGATSMTFDAAERVLTQTDPVGNTTTFGYGPSSTPALTAGQTLVTDPAGHQTLDSYTGGLLTAETKGYGTTVAGTWSYTYDPLSLGVTTESDPNGNLQTFSYDEHGNRTSASNALGYTTLWRYDDHGKVIESVDPMGVATVNGYDQTDHIPPGTDIPPGGYSSVAPSRILDTRRGVGAPMAAVPASGQLAVQVAGVGGVPATGVAAVAVNLTATSPTAAGSLTAWADGGTQPSTSNMNFDSGQTIANFAVVPVGADGKIRILNGSAGTTQIIADTQGYYTAAGIGDLTSTTITQANNVADSTTGNFGTAPTRTANYYYTDPAHPADLSKIVDPLGHASTATYDAYG